MSAEHIIQELQYMSDTNFLPKDLAQGVKRIREEDMPNAYKDEDDEYAKEIVKVLRTIRESAKKYERDLRKGKQAGRLPKASSSSSSSGMQPKQPIPTETPYGDTGGEGTKRRDRPLGSKTKTK